MTNKITAFIEQERQLLKTKDVTSLADFYVDTVLCGKEIDEQQCHDAFIYGYDQGFNQLRTSHAQALDALEIAMDALAACKHYSCPEDVEGECEEAITRIEKLLTKKAGE